MVWSVVFGKSKEEVRLGRKVEEEGEVWLVVGDKAEYAILGRDWEEGGRRVEFDVGKEKSSACRKDVGWTTRSSSSETAKEMRGSREIN